VGDASEFLIRHGWQVLFVWVLAEQLGVPVPAFPLLLAAGALGRRSAIGLPAAFAAALAASLLADIFWYEIGRRRGTAVMRFLCRISLEPDSCVRRTEDLFSRHGARSLLVAKFVPGLSTAAPPLAGIFRMRFSRFLLFSAIGAALWAGGTMLAGYLLSDQLEALVQAAERFGSLLGFALAGLVAYMVLKWINRRRFLHKLRIARIHPEELKRRLDAGEELVIIDLRSSVDFEAAPETIPGSLRVDQDAFVTQHQRIPRDREIILFCT
jgi:membrane protein DedA with SNARE-associated domain